MDFHNKTSQKTGHHDKGGASILEYKTDPEKAAEIFVGGPVPQSDFGVWKNFSHNKKNYSIKRLVTDSLLIKAWGGPNAGKVYHYVRDKPLEKRKPVLSHKPKIPQDFISDIQAAFSSFKKAPSVHAYLKAKGLDLSLAHIDFRVDSNGNLIVPFFSLKTGEMAGWQVIASKAKEGKFKKWTRKGSSTSGIYLRIGPDTAEHIFVAEGVATAGTVFEKAIDAVVICTFGKNNLDITTEKLLKEFPNKMIFQVLDRDKDMFETKIRSDRLRQLCPDEPGDFNDYQDNKTEIAKLKNREPCYTPQTEKEKLGATDYHPAEDEAQDLINRIASIGYEMRDNILSFKCEIKKPDEKKWVELDDKDEDALFLKVKDIGKQKLRKGDFKIRKNAALSLLKVNPFLLFLDDLPEWDGSNRLDTLFENLFEIPDKDQLPLVRAAGFNLFGGIVRRNLYPGCDHDEVLTIYAPQGTGKSSLLMAVVPSPDMFSDSISFLDGYQKFTESLEGKILCEWAEMVGARRSDVGRMKNWISKRKDDVRKAYRRNQRGYDRQCLFVATIDEKIALPDDKNRRFVLFEIKKKFSVKKMLQTLKEQPLPQLWAEALHRIKAGESPRLHKSLWAASAKAAEKHRAVDEVFEAAFLKEILARTQKNSPTIEYKGEKYHWFFMVDALNPLCHTKDERRIIKEPSKHYQREGGKIAGREEVGFERINKRFEGVDTRIWIRPIHWSRPEGP